MCPGFAPDNAANCARRYAIYSGKFRIVILASCMLFAHEIDLFLCKARSVMLFTLWWIVASLCVHINNVVLVRSKPQVVRMNTAPSVAFVQNPKFVRDGPIVKFIRVAMRKNGISAIAKPPITTVLDMRRPIPALCTQDGMNRPMLVDFGPETELNGLAPVMTADKANGLALNVAFFRIVVLTNRCRQAAATFTEFWRDFLCVHRLNYTSFSSVGR